MNIEEILAAFDPESKEPLTEEQKNKLGDLSDEELKALATRYPNRASNNAYLILNDTKVAENKQLGNRSTWQNLYNLRVLTKQRHWVAAGFARELPKKQATRQQLKVSAVQDIKDEERLKQPGLVQTPDQKQNSETGEEFADLSSEAAKAYAAKINQDAKATPENTQGNTQDTTQGQTTEGGQQSTQEGTNSTNTNTTTGGNTGRSRR